MSGTKRPHAPSIAKKIRAEKATSSTREKLGLARIVLHRPRPIEFAVIDIEDKLGGLVAFVAATDPAIMPRVVGVSTPSLYR